MVERKGLSKARAGAAHGRLRSKALLDSAQILEAVANSCPIPQFVIDRDHRIMDWNHALEEISGIKAKEVIGTNQQWRAFYDQERPCLADLLVDGHMERIAELYAGKCSKSRLVPDAYEATDYFPALGKKGAWLHFTAATIKDSKGNVIGALETLEDITDRRRAEEALANERKVLRTVIDNLPDNIFIKDTDSRFIDSNLAHVHHLRAKSLDEIVGKTDFDMYPREMAASYYEDEQAVIRSGQPLVNREERTIDPEGKTRWLLTTKVPLHDDHGKIIGIAGINRDITARKRVEEMLANERNVLRTLIDNLPDNIFIKDVKSRFVLSNRAHVHDLRARSLDEIVGKTDFDIFPREMAAGFYDDEQEVIRSGQPLVNREERALDPEGKPRWLLTTKVPLRDDHGKIIGIAGVNRDITERKLMEDKIKRYSEHLEELVKERTKKLQESESRYRRLFESSPISLWEEDFSEVKRYFDELRNKGIKDLKAHLTEHPDDVEKCASMVKVVDVNDATLGLYGAKSLDELLGELRKVLGHDSQVQFIEELVALGEGETRFASEFDNQTVPGEVRHVSLILSVVPGYEDTLAKVLVSIIDLTDRKKMEKRLQQAEHLAAIGETASMVAHDLRNPLQGIVGATFALRNEALTKEQRNEMLSLIENNVEYSDGIVKDLLDYSRTFDLLLVESSPKKVVMNALQMLKIPDKIKIQDVSLEQPVIAVDSDRMKRAFVNLIENAIDAMPDGGTLTISSRQLNGFVEIAFSDTGTGIAEKAMKNLWKPLQTTKAKGMGMGLAICKRIIDAHGGKVSVESKTGHGTAFTIQLPIKPKMVS